MVAHGGHGSLWDTQLSLIDARTLKAGQRRRDRQGTFFLSLGEPKTGRAAAGTLSRRSERLLNAYVALLGVELHADAPIFRNRSRTPNTKSAFNDDFRGLRIELFGPADKKQSRTSDGAERSKPMPAALPIQTCRPRWRTRLPPPRAFGRPITRCLSLPSGAPMRLVDVAAPFSENRRPTKSITRPARKVSRRTKRSANCLKRMAGATGLEPATSGVTGRHSNQLSYAPAGGRDTKRSRPR
jgi:hypothetical protein